MDKKIQKILLEELEKDYPDFSKDWRNRFNAGLPLPNEARKEIAYLKEEHYIEENTLVREYLKITKEGRKYLDKLREELKYKKENSLKI